MNNEKHDLLNSYWNSKGLKNQRGPPQREGGLKRHRKNPIPYGPKEGGL